MTPQSVQTAIAAAVTPVVMISANAILVSAISSKHQSMSDRLRALTAEWREPGTPAGRRAVLVSQIVLFDRRLGWITWSHIVLYTATACFILMVIDIAASTTMNSWSGISLVLLIGGVSLTFAGIVLELMDLAKARRTTALEIADVTQKP